MLHRQFVVSLAVSLLGTIVMAQDVRLYGDSEAVDPQEVARILQQQPAPGVKFRSIRMLGDKAPAQQAATEPAARPSALALPVQFAFNSADILPAARTQLDALAQGIRLLPAEKAVRVEGHTDATGGKDYNDRLSLRRAQSVKRYLVAQHGLDPARLRAVGMGEQAPLSGLDAHAPENRRVQFRGE